MSSKGTQIVVQKNVSFSESLLWEKQRAFFETEGVSAWDTQVPFYITSNPYIVHTYSQLILNFIADQVKNGHYNPAQPFFILELGTGPGKFSFHFVTHLEKLKKELGLSDIKICLVMTDFTDSNVNFWKKQDVFARALQENHLDFAFFDVEKDKEFHLIHQNLKLNKNNILNPIIGIGNYLFDSIPHDVFHSEDGVLKEAAVELKSRSPDAKHIDKLKVEDIETGFHYRAMRQPYYKDKQLEAVLRSYEKVFQKRTTFLLPIAGLRMFQNLCELSNRRLFFVSSDKGYTYPAEIEGRGDPMVALHGNCFSMMVNFHAMGVFCEQNGGDFRHQSMRRGIKTSVFMIGEKFENLPKTQYAFQTFVEDFGPTDFFNYHKQFRDHKEHCDLDGILSHLRLSRWDPRIFNLFAPRIVDRINQLDEQSLYTLQEGAKELARNIYPITGSGEYYFDLAVFYHAQSLYNEALGFYEKAKAFGKPEYSVIFNTGLCHFALEQFAQAKVCFEESLRLNPDSEDAQKWLEKMENPV